jgi:serine/threonine-protein kinase
MATVYLARAEGLGGFDRYVAVKVAAEHLRSDPEFAHHLLEEAKLVAHLRHPNVVTVLDVAEDALGGVFLVMEYVPGDSLAGLRKRAKQAKTMLHPRLGLRILIDSLAGLHAAHEHADEDGVSHRIVHRDFSPQNILVGTDGIARLTDFGIAKAVSRASITIAGTMKGKVTYASPEQALGKDLDRRCDVWAAGVVAWEILAGRKLYTASDKTLVEIVKEPPPRVSTVSPRVPRELDDVIAAALQHDIDARPPTAMALARALTTAARQANMLAEVDEVAEYVRTAVAPVLEERKQRMAEAKRARSQPTLEASSSPSGENPAAITGPLMMGPAGITGPIHPGITGPLMPPLSAGPFSSSATPPAVATTRPSAAALLDRLRDVSRTGLHQAVKLAERRPKLVIGGAAAVTTVLLLTAILVAVGSSSDKSTAKKPAASAAPPPAVAAAPTAAATLDEAEALPPQLELSANFPISRIRIGDRTVDMEVPAPKVSVELLPEESQQNLSLSATSSDGRVATANWAPGDNAVTLTFGPRPAKKKH